ncbi:uncharacterized protein N0V89_007160 [Didymosphaeria variabile]|uniref:Uncharacterized protein n=1 Tax=Didymosphaeria variabile TaxID=1932322 RepID=A0A9W8XKC0_9PLEO|nr:uncharacterized protein N0V89_007160 [Didymosphaeria variabile]KAJ4351816.1 hypothetical protein N0V89_007160 [Didymosphaeria variabile]
MSPPPSAMNLPSSSSSYEATFTAPSNPTPPFSRGSTSATQPIKLPNVVQNLQQLKNQSTTNLAIAAPAEQRVTARDTEEGFGAYSRPLQQSASSPVLSPPLSAPPTVPRLEPVTATQISNEVLGYTQDASHTTLSQHSTHDPLGTQTRRGVASDAGVPPSNASGGQHSQSIITTIATVKEGKEKKKRTPEEKAERQAKKEAKAAKKEAKVKRQAEKTKLFQNAQARSLHNAATLAKSLDNQDYSKSQDAPHTANRASLPSSRSVVPSNHQMVPKGLTDSVRTSPIPLPLEVNCLGMAETSASQGAPQRKMRKRDHCTSVEPIDRAQEQKTKEHTSKTSIEGSERYQERNIKEHKSKTSRRPVPTMVTPTHATQPDPGPVSPPQELQSKRSQFNTTQPQVIIIQQPSPPSHHVPFVSPPSHQTPYASNEYSYSRVDMRYEPQHHQSGDPEFTLNTLVKPTSTRGSYTYLPLAQNDVVATAYSHDYGQQVTSASHPAMMIGHEAEDDRDDSYGCCSWLYGGRESEYQMEEAKGKQAKRPKKQKAKDEDDDDVCVVM